MLSMHQNSVIYKEEIANGGIFDLGTCRPIAQSGLSIVVRFIGIKLDAGAVSNKKHFI